MWSYPYPDDVLAPVSILYAGFHLLVFLGMLGLARSGYAGPSRGARMGTGLVPLQRRGAQARTPRHSVAVGERDPRRHGG
jgi:hypothetical protein